MSDKHFIGLVYSILSSAEAALGEAHSPVLSHLAKDGALKRRTAEKSLELLQMLERKTLGNLDDTEQQALHQARKTIEEKLMFSEKN
jgi:histone H3/H4